MWTSHWIHTWPRTRTLEPLTIHHSTTTPRLMPNQALHLQRLSTHKGQPSRSSTPHNRKRLLAQIQPDLLLSTKSNIPTVPTTRPRCLHQWMWNSSLDTLKLGRSLPTTTSCMDHHLTHDLCACQFANITRSSEPPVPESPNATSDGETSGSSTESSTPPRSHHLYNAGPTEDGLYHCPFAATEDCGHEPKGLKCEYEYVINPAGAASSKQY